MSVQWINSDGKISAWLDKNCGFFINGILFFWVDIFLDLVTVWLCQMVKVSMEVQEWHLKVNFTKKMDCTTEPSISKAVHQFWTHTLPKLYFIYNFSFSFLSWQCSSVSSMAASISGDPGSIPWVASLFLSKGLLLLRALPGILVFAGTNRISANFRCV